MRIRSLLKEFGRKCYEEESQPFKEDILDCALGYNSLGTSEKVVALAKRYDWSRMPHPPDTSYKDLKKEICRFWSDYGNVEVKNVKVGNGSIVVLSRMSKLFIEPGVKVLGYVPQFKEYENEVKILGGAYEAMLLKAEENYKFDVERFLSQMRKGYSLIYIDNPNNPTGQNLSLDTMEAVLKEAARNEVIVIADEAYGDYLEERYSAINLIHKYKNLIVTRTFSKGYGVGEFRVGYAILSAELGEFYDRLDLPFSIPNIGAALAREALLDQHFITNVRKRVKAEKEKLTQALCKMGYRVAETWPSCPLFILTHKEKKSDLKQDLLSKGVLTTSGVDWQNLNHHYVRINTPADSANFLRRLGKLD